MKPYNKINKATRETRGKRDFGGKVHFSERPEMDDIPTHQYMPHRRKISTALKPHDGQKPAPRGKTPLTPCSR